MSNLEQLAQDYGRVELAISFLEENVNRQPELTEIAAAVGLSEFHFQRLFGRWVGISPKRFLQFLTKEHARELLQGSTSLLEAAYEAGLSGPGRLHDLFVNCEAVTPAQARSGGEGIGIAYAFHPSPFGTCLLAVTEHGVCGLRFVRNANQQELVESLRKQWPAAAISERSSKTRPFLEKIFAFPPDREPAPLHLYVRGTNFQIQVWQALLKIPLGRAVTYGDIARHLNLPQAARAVGNAVGANPIPFLIPCHRVIRASGQFGNYGEGPARKMAILAWESARRETT